MAPPAADTPLTTVSPIDVAVSPVAEVRLTLVTRADDTRPAEAKSATVALAELALSFEWAYRGPWASSLWPAGEDASARTG